MDVSWPAMMVGIFRGMSADRAGSKRALRSDDDCRTSTEAGRHDDARGFLPLWGVVRFSVESDAPQPDQLLPLLDLRKTAGAVGSCDQSRRRETGR